MTNAHTPAVTLAPEVIARYVARIRKANASLSTMGSMLLWMEFETMPAEDRTTIREACRVRGIDWKGVGA